MRFSSAGPALRRRGSRSVDMADEVEKPDVKRVLAAMMFGAKSPLTIGDIRRVFGKLAAEGPEETRDMARLGESEYGGARALQQDRRESRRIRRGTGVDSRPTGLRAHKPGFARPYASAPSRARDRTRHRSLPPARYALGDRGGPRRERGFDHAQPGRNQLVSIVGRSELPGARPVRDHPVFLNISASGALASCPA